MIFTVVFVWVLRNSWLRKSYLHDFMWMAVLFGFIFAYSFLVNELLGPVAMNAYNFIVFISWISCSAILGIIHISQPLQLKWLNNAVLSSHELEKLSCLELHAHIRDIFNEAIRIKHGEPFKYINELKDIPTELRGHKLSFYERVKDEMHKINEFHLKKENHQSTSNSEYIFGKGTRFDGLRVTARFSVTRACYAKRGQAKHYKDRAIEELDGWRFRLVRRDSEIHGTMYQYMYNIATGQAYELDYRQMETVEMTHVLGSRSTEPL